MNALSISLYPHSLFVLQGLSTILPFVQSRVIKVCIISIALIVRLSTVQYFTLQVSLKDLRAVVEHEYSLIENAEEDARTALLAISMAMTLVFCAVLRLGGVYHYRALASSQPRFSIDAAESAQLIPIIWSNSTD